MNDSIYSKPDPKLRQIFERAGSPDKVLCAPIDYAKTKHTVLFCDGRGDILKKAFPIENSKSGLDSLIAELKATCRHRGLSPDHAFFGGEDVPAWAENFICALQDKGFPVARVNAWEAKKQRENQQASSDALDLLGIAQCLLKCRGKLTPAVHDDYRLLRDLCRERHAVVDSNTALTNRLHNYVDRLFSEFLNVRNSGITPFSPLFWSLLQDRFSAPQIASRRSKSLIKVFQDHGVDNAAEAVDTLQALARQCLPPVHSRVEGWQQIVESIAREWLVADATINQFNRQIAAILGRLPDALLTSIPGIGITLVSGCVSELGPVNEWPNLSRLCSYSGTIPATKQTGGPDHAPQVLGVKKRCNRHLKNYILQAAMKMGQMGPPDLQERYCQIQDRQGAANFVLAKELLGLFKSLLTRQTVFLPMRLYASDSRPEDRAAYFLELWPKLRAKWQLKAPVSQVFAPETPLGKWRLMVQECYKISLPLPQSIRSNESQAGTSTTGASPARLK
jgi:transposase